MKRPICGVGVNDADYAVTRNKTVDGKQIRVWQCRYYLTWVAMIKRCYDEVYHVTHPSYLDCTVCNEWLTFSSFRLWMADQNWVGLQLDKDILNPGANHYSPSTCIFVSRELNMFFAYNQRKVSNLPTGVTACRGGYIAQISHQGVASKIGHYKTPEEAHKRYLERKSELLIDIIYELDDTEARLKKGLLKHLEILQQ